EAEGQIALARRDTVTKDALYGKWRAIAAHDLPTATLPIRTALADEPILREGKVALVQHDGQHLGGHGMRGAEPTRGGEGARRWQSHVSAAAKGGVAVPERGDFHEEVRVRH